MASSWFHSDITGRQSNFLFVHDRLAGRGSCVDLFTNYKRLMIWLKFFKACYYRCQDVTPCLCIQETWKERDALFRVLLSCSLHSEKRISVNYSFNVLIHSLKKLLLTFISVSAYECFIALKNVMLLIGNCFVCHIQRLVIAYCMTPLTFLRKVTNVKNGFVGKTQIVMQQHTFSQSSTQSLCKSW